MTDKIEKIAEPVFTTGSFQLSAQLGSNSGKTLSISGYIYSDSTEKSVHDAITAMHNVLDKQVARAEIPALEAHLEQRIKTLGEHLQHLKELQGNNKPKVQDKSMIENLKISIVRIEEDITKGKEVIAEARKKAAGH